MNNDLIEQFLDKKAITASKQLVETSDDAEVVSSSVQLADVYGLGDSFKKIAENKDDSEEKLVSSFGNNMVLLIQKTWVEKSDEELKARVLYQLEEFSKKLSDKLYGDAFKDFFEIVDNMVYLMFGSQAKSKDFDEYALRIDPEFGLFWWYIESLPRDAEWSSSKTRVALLLGMYFLANY